MKMLYSDILPFSMEDSCQTVADYFFEQTAKSDRIGIAVGYISKAALDKLAAVVGKYNLEAVN